VAGLFGAKFSGEIDRNNPPNALAASYPTSDKRWVLLVFAEEDKNWAAFTKGVDRVDLQADPRFADAKNRHKNSAALVAELDRLFGSQPLAYWKKVLDAARVPYGVVQTPEEIVNDPQLYANEIVVPINDGSANPKYTVSSPLSVKEAPKVAPRTAPGLGEHSEEILKELGFTAEQVEQLEASGAVPEAPHRDAVITGD
jgi:formyl-CoA transferase